MVDLATLVDLPEDGGYGPVHRLENGMLPTGGPVNLDLNEGILNWPLQQLAGRTAWLKEAVDTINAGLAGAISEADVNALIAAAVANLVGGAPGALDTLNELAAALGDNENFAASVTAALAGKAATSHTHTIADVTALQPALDAKLSIGATLLPDYESAELSLSSAYSFTLAHGFGVRPSRVRLLYKILSNTNGYNVGDYVDLSFLANMTSTSTAGVAVKISASGVELKGPNQSTWFTQSFTTGAAVSISWADVALIVQAWK